MLARLRRAGWTFLNLLHVFIVFFTVSTLDVEKFATASKFARGMEGQTKRLRRRHRLLLFVALTDTDQSTRDQQ